MSRKHLQVFDLRISSGEDGGLSCCITAPRTDQFGEAVDQFVRCHKVFNTSNLFSRHCRTDQARALPLVSRDSRWPSAFEGLWPSWICPAWPVAGQTSIRWGLRKREQNSHFCPHRRLMCTQDTRSTRLQPLEVGRAWGMGRSLWPRELECKAL